MEGKHSRSLFPSLVYMSLEQVTNFIHANAAPFSAAVKMERYGDGMW